jgi:hypothetical protein
VSKCGFGLCQVMKTEKKHKTEIVDATYRFRAAIAKSQRQQNNINWWCDVTSNSKVPELNLVARYAAHERVLSKRHNSQLVLNSTLLREALILSQSRQKHHFCRCVCWMLYVVMYCEVANVNKEYLFFIFCIKCGKIVKTASEDKTVINWGGGGGGVICSPLKLPNFHVKWCTLRLSSNLTDWRINHFHLWWQKNYNL